MRHARRHLTLIFGFGLAFLSATGDADAQTFPGALRGDYNFSASRNCKIVGTASQIHIAVTGTATFDPNLGTVSITGRSTATSSVEVNSANQTCTGTYSVNANGILSETLNCNLSFFDGPLAPGGTATLTGIDLEGQLSLDGTVVLLRNAAPNSETFQLLTEASGSPAGPIPGAPTDRTCSVSGVATSRR